MVVGCGSPARMHMHPLASYLYFYRSFIISQDRCMQALISIQFGIHYIVFEA